MGKMTAYFALLNELHAEGDSALDLDQVEHFGSPESSTSPRAYRWSCDWIR